MDDMQCPVMQSDYNVSLFIMKDSIDQETSA